MACAAGLEVAILVCGQKTQVVLTQGMLILSQWRPRMQVCNDISMHMSGNHSDALR